MLKLTDSSRVTCCITIPVRGSALVVDFEFGNMSLSPSLIIMKKLQNRDAPTPEGSGVALFCANLRYSPVDSRYALKVSWTVRDSYSSRLLLRKIDILQLILVPLRTKPRNDLNLTCGDNLESNICCSRPFSIGATKVKRDEYSPQLYCYRAWHVYHQSHQDKLRSDMRHARLEWNE